MDKNESSFLDTIVYRSPTSRIYTRIYHKPTDQKHYLHYHSAHPRNWKESVPYGLLIRCRSIHTEDHHFEEEAKKIYNQLKYGKYPTNLLNQANDRVRNIDRLTLLWNQKYTPNHNPNFLNHIGNQDVWLASTWIPFKLSLIKTTIHIP